MNSRDRLRSAATRSRDAASRVAAGARNSAIELNDRAQTLIEVRIDRIFDEPLDVPDAEAARMMLRDVKERGPSAASAFIAGRAGERLVKTVARFVARFATTGNALGRGAKVAGSKLGSVGVAATAAELSAATVRRTRTTVERGVLELKVLSSLLASQARRERVALDKALIRAVTVEIYLDPQGPVGLGYRGSRASRKLTKRWAQEAAASSSDEDLYARSDLRIKAIERLDLHDLTKRWGGLNT